MTLEMRSAQRSSLALIKLEVHAMLLFMHREQNISESAFPAGVKMTAFLVHTRADMLPVQLSKDWY